MSEDAVMYSVGPNKAFFDRLASLLLGGWQFVM